MLFRICKGLNGKVFYLLLYAEAFRTVLLFTLVSR